MIKTTRRRLLTIIAAAPGLALLPDGVAASTPPRWRWHGTALGAKAEIVLVHPDEAKAAKLIRLAVDEIERLENIFSLYRENSEISRLNHAGRIHTPSADLVALLSTAHQISEQTDGAFDVTVQPLWQLYASHFSKAHAAPEGPSPAAIDAVRDLVDYTAIDIEPSAVSFARPGTAITLNGIAQGYITDRVTGLLHAHGIEQTLIDLGEIRALGRHPDGRPWQIAIEGEQQRGPVELVDRAIATSSTDGTIFDRKGRFHHLFDPTTGRPSRTGQQLSVTAKNATLADALSTALTAMPARQRVRWQRKAPDILVYRTS